MATFTKLANERLDYMHAIPLQEQKSIEDVYTDITQIHNTLFLEYNAIAHAILQLTQYVTHDVLLDI